MFEYTKTCDGSRQMRFSIGVLPLSWDSTVVASVKINIERSL